MEETTNLLVLNKPLKSSLSARKLFRNSKVPSTSTSSNYGSVTNCETQYSEQEETTINEMLNSLLIRIECPENVCTSERLSHIVFSETKNKNKVGINTTSHADWYIHAYLPAKYLGEDLCSDVKIVLKRKGKLKSSLMELKQSLMDNYDEQKGYISFSASFSKFMYNTGIDPCWVTATCGRFEKKKFLINTFEKSIPSSLRSIPSCWNVFFEISNSIHQNIEQGEREERFELAKVINFWATIIAVQTNENKQNRENFCLIDGGFPRSIAKIDELRNSPIFLLMFILFNLEKHPEMNNGIEHAKQLEQILSVIDLGLQSYRNTKKNRANSLVFLLNRISQQGMIYLKDVRDKKIFLSRELGGTFSHLLCLTNISNKDELVANILSLYFRLISDCLSQH